MHGVAKPTAKFWLTNRVAVSRDRSRIDQPIRLFLEIVLSGIKKIFQPGVLSLNMLVYKTGASGSVTTTMRIA